MELQLAKTIKAIESLFDYVGLPDILCACVCTRIVRVLYMSHVEFVKQICVSTLFEIIPLFKYFACNAILSKLI